MKKEIKNIVDDINKKNEEITSKKDSTYSYLQIFLFHVSVIFLIPFLIYLIINFIINIKFLTEYTYIQLLGMYVVIRLSRIPYSSK